LSFTSCVAKFQFTKTCTPHIRTYIISVDIFLIFLHRMRTIITIFRKPRPILPTLITSIPMELLSLPLASKNLWLLSGPVCRLWKTPYQVLSKTLLVVSRLSILMQIQTFNQTIASNSRILDQFSVLRSDVDILCERCAAVEK